MPDEISSKDTKIVVEQELMPGLTIVSNFSTDGNASQTTVVVEDDSKSVSNINSNDSVNTKPKLTPDPKKVSIVEPKEEASGTNEDLEVALQEGENHEDRLEDDIGMQTGVAKKKKKSKKKPKSQRGLVRSESTLK